jgi:mono/diheme cytochrome c family protein
VKKVSFALVLMAATAAIASALLAFSSMQSRSIWDGVYTEEQATRGSEIYLKDCSSCHGEDLMGRDESTPLAGALFLSNWDGLTVGDLYDRVRVSMPQDNPGKLSRQETADVLAYVFQVNQFPAGEAELARQTEVLKEIRLVATKPGQ